MIRNLILPMGIMVGTTIGAGIFSLPYVFAKSGMALGIIYLILFSIVSFIIHLMYADIIVRTREDHHRFPGYARIYLGEKFSFLANIVIFSALTLTLTAYLVLSVSFSDLIFPQLPLYAKIGAFWFLGSMAIFLGIKKAALFESLTTLITLAAIIVIFGLGVSGFSHKIASLPQINWKYVFFPFGPVLFSLFGETAIPALIVYFKKEGFDVRAVRKTLFWSSFATSLFYFLFIAGIIGLSKTVSEDAVSGLKNFPSFILIILGIFGFVSLWDSYASAGTDIKKTLEYEWKIPGFLIGIILIFLPLSFYIAGLQNFLSLIGIIGGVLFSIWGLMIIFIWKKARQADRADGISILGIMNPAILFLILLILLIGLIQHFL